MGGVAETCGENASQPVRVRRATFPAKGVREGDRTLEKACFWSAFSKVPSQNPF